MRFLKFLSLRSVRLGCWYWAAVRRSRIRGLRDCVSNLAVPAESVGDDRKVLHC